jgi:uncharacterized membrane protein YjdF
MLHLRRAHLGPLAALLLVLVPFTVFFVYRQNHEFLLYAGVIVFFLVVVALTNGRVRYPMPILWGLVIWAIMHMCGGGIPVGEGVLYGVMLVPLSDTIPVIRYDQVVHVFGFGVSTLLMHHLLRPILRKDIRHFTALSIVVVMAGLGTGALNEIVEFIATLLMPETGVGGYMNTSLDMVANFAGAVLAVILLRLSSYNPRWLGYEEDPEKPHPDYHGAVS